MTYLSRLSSRNGRLWAGTTMMIGLAFGCSQRTEWQDHYIEAPRPPKPRPNQPDPITSDTTGDASTTSSELDAAVTDPTSGDAGSDAGAKGPLAEGAPIVNAKPSELEFDVFGAYDTRYWFVVSSDQVEAMNTPDGSQNGDYYSPGAGGATATYADHLLITDGHGKTADWGKLKTKLVGGVTHRPWTESTLPNLEIDVDEYQEGARIGGYEHLRFHNAVFGTIFREKFAYDYYRALGYPAPNAGFAWISSSIWGAGIEVPYVVVEPYKLQFCGERADYFGGECPNVWAFTGDVDGAFASAENCQYERCETNRAEELADAVRNASYGDGFKAALAEYLDWDAFHEFQCLSWMFGTSDDYVHWGNNVVLAERTDGKFQFLPQSVDISFTNERGSLTPLTGRSTLAMGCQSDPECWADTIAICAQLVTDFIDSNPAERLDTLYADLERAGMLRPGDAKRYEDMRRGLEATVERLPDELTFWRDNPMAETYCELPLIPCWYGCTLPEECDECGAGPMPPPPPWPPIPDEPRPLPEPLEVVGAIPLPPDETLADAPDGGVTDSGATTETETNTTTSDATTKPDECLPRDDYYRVANP